nr:GGDEF domain-containing phosphodiesterase [Granulosicoccus sp.]
VTVSGSVGCAFFPADGKDSETLVRHADTAMYHAKAQGKNCMAFFKPEMSTTDQAFLRLDQEMRSAIANDRFCLYFQPKIDLASGEICGVEALMRWLEQSPKGIKFHSCPDEFIPIAESTGFITQLDLYALDQACMVARQWELKGRSLPVAVNLSVVLLQKDNVVELIANIINKYELTPSLIEFEITESAVMTEVESNVIKLGQLREMGFRISIDDFGTGYSSLSYLKKLPINCLKIDRSFISDVKSIKSDESIDAAIVRSVVALGKSLDLILVAEGVESRAQMDMIRQLGCEQAQGFLFARPLPLDELELLLEHERGYCRVA